MFPHSPRAHFPARQLKFRVGEFSGRMNMNRYECKKGRGVFNLAVALGVVFCIYGVATLNSKASFTTFFLLNIFKIYTIHEHYYL